MSLSPASTAEALVGSRSRQFMLHVYNWMTFGLSLTALLSLAVSSSESALYWFATHPMAFYGLLIGEFALVMVFSARIGKLAYSTALGMFIAYAALNGVTFSVLFLVYTAQSVASAFFIAAGTFAGASLFGTVTKRDLTGMGHFLGMALWGIILAIVVNIFLRSSGLSFVISGVAVIVFVGLTAYDTQKLRRWSISPLPGEDLSSPELGTEAKKIALSGALTLYLDFINLFLHLLRLTGNRR